MPRSAERPRPTPPSTWGHVSVPGTRAGAIVSLGLVVIAWLVIPIARPFLLGVAGLGSVIGLILRWKHSK